MAIKGDIYKVALPNGDEYNFKDKYVRENYRALNNNDYDTINVTELNSGNIINTGAARFLNTINGSISGNAATATTASKATSASYISAFRASIASTADLDALKGDGIKYANVQANIASNYGDGLVVAIPWSGNSNYATQLYFDDSSYVCGHRYLNNGTWSDWKQFIDESNYTDYTVKKDGTGASGTWGISISGNAATATKANSIATDVGSSAGARPVFYSWLGDTTKVVYDNNFNYNPSGGVLTATKFVGSLQGNADSATLLNQDTTYKEGTAYICQTSAGTVKAFCSRANNSNIGLSTTGYGCMLLSATWGGGTSYNGELFMGMGDFPNLYFRGKNNGTYTSWNAIGQFTATPTSGQVVITDGTTGGMKSSGYTIAKSVPSNAVFTDTNYYHTTGSWSGLTYTATANGGAGALAFTIPTGTSATTVAVGNHNHDGTYVKVAGDSMTGPLCVNATGGQGSYDEGIRINAGKNNYSTLIIGGAANSTTGTSDKTFWIGTNIENANYYRKLFIAHNSSTASETYFYASSATDHSPSLQVGGIIAGKGVVAANVANSSTAGGLALYGTSPTDYGIAFRGTGNGGKHGYVQGDWAQYHYMAGADTRGWVFNAGTSTGVASISRAGHMVLNGSLTVGGNAANTSGVRQVYNSTTNSLDFVFVA